MTTYLIELIESLRKLSAENASPRDCIDEAADKLGALAAEVEHWRDEWSEVCNDNQILHNAIDEAQDFIRDITAENKQERALLNQALEALCLPCARWNKQQTQIVNAAIAAIRVEFGEAK